MNFSPLRLMKSIGISYAGFVVLAMFILGNVFTPYAAAQSLYTNVKKSTVFIASYNYKGDLLGRGSGFYIDEGIVITNMHVIYGAARYYRIFTTGDDDSLDPKCYRDINRSNIKLNLEDDVAYIRVFIDCPHGSVYFADTDPKVGDTIEILGYPALGENFSSSFDLVRTTGEVLEEVASVIIAGQEKGPWLRTSAIIHGGNSGGPVVQIGKVVGIAVAASIDKYGNALDGLFIPASEVMRGLEYANDSTFAYTPQERQKNPVYIKYEEEQKQTLEIDPFNPPMQDNRNASNRECLASLGPGGEATGYGGCRCKGSYRKNSTGTGCTPGAEGWVDPYYTIAKNLSDNKSVQADVNNEFTDVDKKSYAYTAIKSLKESGIIDGYSDGSFRPNHSVNRAELLKIIVEGFYSQEIHGETECFPDVHDEWFAPYVCAAKRLGWISGYPDGTFRPSNTVNRAEAIKIITSSLIETPEIAGYLPTDVNRSTWFAKYVSGALQLGILSSYGMFRPDAELIRVDATLWIYNGANANPPPEPVAPPPPSSCIVKGNISYYKDQKIYHVPDCPNYEDAVITPERGERCFDTEAKAVAAGWRKAGNCP